MIKQTIFLYITIALILLGCKKNETSNLLQKEISQGWMFTEVTGNYTGKAEVPGTIHTDLLANNLIEDPFYRTNEKQLQWIDKKDWIYETTFTVTNEELNKDNLVMEFKGLDTYADVYINDELLLEADNMFRTWQVSIKKTVHIGENSLKIYLHSPIKKGLTLLEKNYPLPASNDQSENGGLGDKKVSIFTRKAGYHYGWDWGPRLVTSGIWRPVVLKAWDKAIIKDVYMQQQLITKEVAKLNASLDLSTNTDFKGRLVLSNERTGETYISKRIDVKSGNYIIDLPFSINNPELWWSNGLGEQNMYDFSIVLIDDSKQLISEKKLRTGLRSIKLVREKDAQGETFYFELNGVPVFMKGANYIPNDSFLTRVSEDDYKKVVMDAVNANMNMLRVWGGGIYEDDFFYELCDDNGILVWQDFMFACAMYPGDTEFLENVKQEAIDNVVRLRNHPSIALWCGNNEINTAWRYYSKGGWGWKERYSPERQEEIQKAYLDIFHKVLPDVITEYTYAGDYWPSSPQAGYEADLHAGYDSTSGDSHYWGVWHGQHPFEDFEKYKSRFMSEYGFQSFPDFNSVKTYTIPEDYSIESEVMAAHQRSGIGNLRIKEYMEQEYHVPEDFSDFLYLSQVLQAKGIKMAIEAHRRAMPYCMGSLYWQINDCWPVASWSSTDYYHKWKAMHYEVKKAYEPVLLTVSKVDDNIAVHGISDLLEDIEGELQIQVFDFNGASVYEFNRQVNLLKNTSTEFVQIKEQLLIGENNKNKLVLLAEFVVNGKVKSSNLYYFVKTKYLELEEANILTEVVEKKGQWYLKIKAKKLVKNLYIDTGKEPLLLEDNYFDMLPSQEVLILLEDNMPDLDKIKLKHIRQTYDKI